jgi:hypothetical protein
MPAAAAPVDRPSTTHVHEPPTDDQCHATFAIFTTKQQDEAARCQPHLTLQIDTGRVLGQDARLRPDPESRTHHAAAHRYVPRSNVRSRVRPATPLTRIANCSPEPDRTNNVPAVHPPLAEQLTIAA